MKLLPKSITVGFAAIALAVISSGDASARIPCAGGHKAGSQATKAALRAQQQQNARVITRNSQRGGSTAAPVKKVESKSALSARKTHSPTKTTPVVVSDDTLEPNRDRGRRAVNIGAGANSASYDPSDPNRDRGRRGAGVDSEESEEFGEIAAGFRHPMEDSFPIVGGNFDYVGGDLLNSDEGGRVLLAIGLRIMIAILFAFLAILFFTGRAGTSGFAGSRLALGIYACTIAVFTAATFANLAIAWMLPGLFVILIILGARLWSRRFPVEPGPSKSLLLDPALYLLPFTVFALALPGLTAFGHLGEYSGVFVAAAMVVVLPMLILLLILNAHRMRRKTLLGGGVASAVILLMLMLLSGLTPLGVPGGALLALGNPYVFLSVAGLTLLSVVVMFALIRRRRREVAPW